MKVKFLGPDDPLALLNGKEYEVLSTQCGWYRVVDETGGAYLYPPRAFEITESESIPPVEPLEPMPDDMRETSDSEITPAYEDNNSQDVE